MTKRPLRQSHNAVTPEMIKSGLRALEQWKHLPAGELLAAIYRAMAAVAPPEETEIGEISPTVLEVLKRLGHE